MITISLLIYAFISTLFIITICLRLQLAFHRFRIRKPYTAALSAPSVSVCIPARNEVHAMTQCLERVLASDYAKLEIIVFDDSSKDDTSVLIRSFAQAGVRFVPGTNLPDGWLGKNHALEVLANEASGTFIVFMDVDTYIQPTSISQLVGYLTTEQMEMVSVIPGRHDTWRFSVLLGHLRYFWELILGRSTAPATSSSLWMIRRATLLTQFGGFEAVKAHVAPEAALAAALTSKSYHCLISNEALGVSYEKRWQSQLETSRRLLYPMVGATPLAAFFSGLVLLLLNCPLFILIGTVFTGWDMLQLIALWLMLAHMAVYAVYTSHLWQRGWWLGGLLWPLVIFQEFILLLSSILGYARRTVTWKGRVVTAKPTAVQAYVIDQ